MKVKKRKRLGPRFDFSGQDASQLGEPKYITIHQLQLLPVNFISNNGGEFAVVCNKILKGDMKLLT